jgi:hypothetical protein
MPKGTKQSKVFWNTANGRRAVAGVYMGERKTMNGSQSKEYEKKNQSKQQKTYNEPTNEINSKIEIIKT